jgi:cell division protein FtsQ
MEGEKPLSKLPLVSISNDRKYHSLEQKKIMDLAIHKRNIDIVHTPVSKLDVRGIERAIETDPWVQNAQVYIDIERVMHIEVTRRVPVARLFRADGVSYYIDSTLHTMPLSDDYTYYTNVVTNVPDLGDDSAGVGLKKQIVRLAHFINTDSFWSAQVSQIAIDSAGMFELTPVIGEQKILLGDTTRLAGKFANVMVFYKNVLNRIGWDKYQTLDVRFQDQVIASPSLPYKGPVDKAISKMNWITSIEVTEAQKRHEDSIRAEVNHQAAVAAAKAAAAERAQKKYEEAVAAAKAARDREIEKKKAAKHPDPVKAGTSVVGSSAKNVRKPAQQKAVDKAAKKAVKHVAPELKRDLKKAAKGASGAKKPVKANASHSAAKPHTKAAPKKPAAKTGKKDAKGKDAAKKKDKNKSKKDNKNENKTGKYLYPSGH